MYRYAYDSCPVCGLTFTDNDDVVVCPTCGTPHHRECYKNFGGCANTEKHAEGFSFVSSTPIKNDEPEIKTSAESQSDYQSETQSDQNPFKSNGDFTSPFGHTISDAEEIEGVPVGDLKKFIGNAWIYYVTLFYAKVKGMRIFRINFSALIGSYVWLFARKFYLLGSISAILSLVSHLFMDFYEAYIVYAGIDITESLTQILSTDDPMMLLGYYVYIFASNIPVILSVLIGVFANKLYMKRCISDVKAINRSSQNAEQFNSRLSKKGGINMPMMFISLALTASYLILKSRGVIYNLMTALIEYIF